MLTYVAPHKLNNSDAALKQLQKQNWQVGGMARSIEMTQSDVSGRNKHKRCSTSQDKVVLILESYEVVLSLNKIIFKRLNLSGLKRDTKSSTI